MPSTPLSATRFNFFFFFVLLLVTVRQTRRIGSKKKPFFSRSIETHAQTHTLYETICCLPVHTYAVYSAESEQFHNRKKINLLHGTTSKMRFTSVDCVCFSFCCCCVPPNRPEWIPNYNKRFGVLFFQWNKKN